MNTRAIILRLVLLVALLMVPVTAVSAQGNSGEKGYTAHAEFSYNPSGCRVTYGEVTVTQTKVHEPPGPPSTEVVLEDFIYSVRSTCEYPGDFLWYYDTHIEDPVTLEPGDFEINPSLKQATLDTTLTVFDEECGCNVTIGVQIDWTATGKAGPHQRDATATITIVSGLQELYLDNPTPAEGYLAKAN